MIFTSVAALAAEVNKNRDGKKKVSVKTGCFDCFHFDHLQYLQESRYGKENEIVIVAVKGNNAAALKGVGRPIIDEQQRAAIVDNIKGVDYTIVMPYNPGLTLEVEPENETQRQWLCIFQPLFKALRPDTLYYEDNPVLQGARDKVFQAYGITGIKRQRGQHVSTTAIISKIRNQ